MTAAGLKSNEYRGLKLVTANFRGKCQAGVLFGKTRLHIAESLTADEALANARTWIDNHLSVKASTRRAPNIGTADEYEEYLKAYSLEKYELAMLRCGATGVRTSAELAKAAGWDNYEAANLRFGALGGRVGRALGLQFIKFDSTQKDFLSSALADGVKMESSNWSFEMHPELIEALRSQNML